MMKTFPRSALIHFSSESKFEWQVANITVSSIQRVILSLAEKVHYKSQYYVKLDRIFYLGLGVLTVWEFFLLR